MQECTLAAGATEIAMKEGASSRWASSHSSANTATVPTSLGGELVQPPLEHLQLPLLQAHDSAQAAPRSLR